MRWIRANGLIMLLLAGSGLLACVDGRLDGPDAEPDSPDPEPDAQVAPDAAPDGSAACCAAHLICTLCLCDPAERMAIADADPAACQAMLDARPDACAMPPGAQQLSTLDALEFCSAPPAEDYGDVVARCEDCSTGLCYERAGAGVCSQACEPLAAGCPEGSICLGLCAAPGPTRFGEACEADADCRSVQCAQDVCTWRCTGDADCPASHRCDDAICTGDGALGDACARDFDCFDLACVAGTCAETGAALGEPCGSGSDCVSEICAVTAADADGFCTRACTADAPCPADYECRAGQPSLCVPR